MHFWCRLFPMSTDGQAWSIGGEGQKDLDASCSLFRLRMIRCKDCRQLWRAQREEWEGKVAPAVDAPQPSQAAYHWLALTSIIPLLTSACVGPPGADICHHVSGFVLCENKSVLQPSNLRIVVFMLQCLMTPLSILEHWLNIKCFKFILWIPWFPVSDSWLQLLMTCF